MAPSDSKRFSINIAAPDNDSFSNVLFHFNPRQRERGGQLVVNDKRDGIWGQAIALPLSQVPLMFGQTACTLLVQINGEGFDIFLENKHCVRLEHRKELPVGNTNLILQFPSTDDYGSPENWTVYKVCLSFFVFVLHRVCALLTVAWFLVIKGMVGSPTPHGQSGRICSTRCQ
jgi:Galactoside-binding lectin